ncbi:hypothetical protein D3C76_718350 [compost metagenome]
MIEHLLHPALKTHAPALLALIARCQDRVPNPEELSAWMDEDDDLSIAYHWAESLLSANQYRCMGGNVYFVPVLSKEACAAIIDQAEGLAINGGWKRNDCEPSEYQIPEIVVRQRNQPFHDLLAELVDYLNIFHALIYQCVATKIGSIQFTKYSEHDCQNGNWHHDLDSDFTATISLAPHLFEGGGTDVRSTPVTSIHIPPLPAGWALLFNGKRIHHQGAPVTKGSRMLLTYWLS